MVPITNQAKGYPFEVRLPEKMKVTGVVLSDAVKNIDWQARKAKYADVAPLEVMAAVQERLQLLLGFSQALTL